MTIEGKDVSGFQPNFSPAPSDDFVIIKASEGTGYRNPDRDGQVQRARRGGRTVGWYHYLHQGNIAAQARYFVATSGIADADLLICDWEGSAIPSCAEKDAFIRAVKILRPHSRVGLYCNTYTWKHVDTTSYRGDFLHIAQYSSSPPSIATPWKIWQYSDGGGKLDHNKAGFASRADMKAWADGLKPKPAPSGLVIQGKGYTPISYVSVFWVNANRAAKGKYVSRHVFWVQTWLHKVGLYAAALDGRWGAATQAAIYTYRRRLGWNVADSTGAVGLSSVTKLRASAGGGIPVKVK